MSNTNKTEEKTKQICLQAPADLAEWLQRTAKEEQRSVSGQIVYYLSLARFEHKNQGGANGNS